MKARNARNALTRDQGSRLTNRCSCANISTDQRLDSRRTDYFDVDFLDQEYVQEETTMSLDEALDEMKGWLDLKIETGRYSDLLARQLAACCVARSYHVHMILDEIEYLESKPYARPSRTKPASKFKKKPLRGLWHKHFFQPYFFLRNAIQHWKSTDFDQKIARIQSDVSILQDRKVGAVVDAFLSDGYVQRSHAKRITGEWIVFAVHDDAKYYLTLGCHTESGEGILERVRSCCAEFPELDVCR